MYRNDFIAAIKCRGDILREFNGGIIKLPFGTDYSIILKNKSKRRALVDVRIDGDDVLDGNKLIVCYDSPVDLKGYMEGRDVKNSFRFIEKTDKIADFRSNNIDDGIVEITFSFEKELLNDLFVKGNCYENNLDFTYSSGSRDVNSDFYATCSSSTDFRSYDGITVKGKPTTQNFSVGSIGPTDEEHNIVFKLQGNSANMLKKPITVKTKIKCNTCGQTSKATDNYCSNCSTYLQ